MGCCANCFGDSGLAAKIRNDHVDHGTCEYCGSEDVDLVKPQQLRDLFELVVGIYTDQDGGQPLVSLLKSDWAMFGHERMDTAHAKELLAEILDDGEIVRRCFVLSPAYRSDSVREWKEFRDELMRCNRFFPRRTPDTDSLRSWLPHLRANPDDLARTFYRARLQDGPTPFPPEHMGAPPLGRSSHGRANPAGIPYLYLASDQNTAVAEVRPHTGEVASVATFAIDDNLQVVDLRNPRGTVSPFLLEDEQQVGHLRRSMDFLALLGEELTRPVLPSAAHIDYLPSQYLCEFVKHCKFDGVLYRSSVGAGFNLALFDPSRARVGIVVQYKVDRVTVSVQRQP